MPQMSEDNNMEIEKAWDLQNIHCQLTEYFRNSY